MARGRMLSKSISTSEKFAALTHAAGDLAEFCHALYPLLLAHSDDFGRLQGDVYTVKLQCYPASLRTLEEFAAALSHLQRVNLIVWYIVEGKKYLEIANFYPHQLGLHKRTKSRFPEIPGNSGNVREIPGQENGTERNGTEENLEQIPAVAAAPLEQRVQAVLQDAEDFQRTVTARRAELEANIAALRLRFAEFWAHWPRRVDRKAAEQEWLKLKPSAALGDLILQAVDTQKTWPDWLKNNGQFIPHPKTWLHNHRWDDEPPARPPPLAEYEPWTCPHDPHCPHRAACAIVAARGVGLS